MQRRLLDTYCKAGGATRGYQRAGFYVVGVDIELQRHYVGDEFIQADAMDVLADRSFLAGFDVIAASPPCQDHSPLSALAGKHGTGWLLSATRELLMTQPVPWVIENVASAEARADFMLCGTMFGLRTYRHRRFEIDPRLPALFQVPAHRRHRTPAPTRRRVEAWARGEFVSATGNAGSFYGPEGLGIDWMTGDELSQAIPPAYTEYIGGQLLERLTQKAVA
jgi:DNA (cytosine-5)-methyltransferase 1